MKAYNDKQYDTAIENFNEALNYKPTSYSTLCVLGTSYAYINDFKMAEKTFKDAIKLYPNEWNAYVLLGDLKRSRHDYQEAEDYYEIALALEKMGGKEKIYYKKLLKEIKNERLNESLRKVDAMKLAKSEERLPERNDFKRQGEVFLSLDYKVWQKVLDEKNEKSRVIEYAIKGEDVKNFRWSKLITVQYFIISDNYKTTLDAYYNNHLGSIETIAKNSNKNFEKKIISQNKTEIIYEWSFDNSHETEIARIIFIDKNIYHIHYAKKGLFTEKEKKEAIELLKSAELR